VKEDADASRQRGAETKRLRASLAHLGVSILGRGVLVGQNPKGSIRPVVDRGQPEPRAALRNGSALIIGGGAG